MAKMNGPNPVLLAMLAIAGFVLSTARRPSMQTAHAGDGTAPASATPKGGLKDQVDSTHAQRMAGADAAKPSEIPMQGWWHVLKRAAAGFSEDRVMAEAASVTFYALLALFPAIASLISIYGLVADPQTLGAQLTNLEGVVPGGGLDIIKAQLTALTTSGHKALGFGAIVGILTSIWSANAGIKSIFDALNVVYHEREKRSFVRLTLTSLTFTLGAIVFIIVALLTVVAVPIVLKFVGLGGVSDTILSLARWPFMLLVITGGLALIYRYGPSRNRARWQWVSWGGGIAAVGWVVVSLAFSYYVSNFGSYNKTYGSLGAVVGFMTWIWISSITVLMGAELNAELEQQTSRDSTVGEEKPEGSRGAYKADNKV